MPHPNVFPDSLIVSPSTDSIARAADCLLAGNLIGFPTETVYGLAARGDDVSAVNRIFAAKKRPRHNPLILHVACFEDALSLFAADLSQALLRRAERLAAFWPGPLTMIGPRHDRVLDEITAGGETVAVRVPDHPVALAVLRRLAEVAGHPVPVAAPSANVSNYVSPTTADHVAEGLGDQVALILDGGPCRLGLESTIVYLGDDASPARVLRSGALSAECLSRELGEPVVDVPRVVNDNIAAPGQFAKHYSPRTPLILRDELSSSIDSSSTHSGPQRHRVLQIVFGPITPSMRAGGNEVWTFSSDGRLETAAANLYATLRRADAGGYDRIDVVACDASGLGNAILDRLSRASQR